MHILHVTSMLTYLAYFCIFFAFSLHRNAEETYFWDHCIFLHVCAYFVHIYIFFNLHIMAYLSICIFKLIMHICAFKTHI